MALVLLFYVILIFVAYMYINKIPNLQWYDVFYLPLLFFAYLLVFREVCTNTLYNVLCPLYLLEYCLWFPTTNNIENLPYFCDPKHPLFLIIPMGQSGSIFYCTSVVYLLPFLVLCQLHCQPYNHVRPVFQSL